MTDELPELRKEHPFVMYDMIQDTPRGIQATIAKMDALDMGFIRAPLYFTGNGTAFHSAVAGSQILSKTDLEWHTIQAYELEKYLTPRGTVVGVSHTGKTKSTVEALRKSKDYARTVGITHYKDSPLASIAEYPVVIGNSPDRSLCNTKTFFDNAFAAMKIAAWYGDIDVDFEMLYSCVEEAVDNLDKPVRDIAYELGEVNRIFVLGAGPNYVSAREAAQKMKESTHLHVEGIELEEFNHGCTSVIDDRSLLVIIETPTVRERSVDIVKACRETGTRTVVVNGDGDYSITTPVLADEYYTPLVNMVALYYLAYHLAVARGTNPDYLRFDEKGYREFDDVVFPPGAH